MAHLRRDIGQGRLVPCLIACTAFFAGQAGAQSSSLQNDAAARLYTASSHDAATPVGRDETARRAVRGDFDARGTIPCAQIEGQALQDCDAAVARAPGGNATLVATFSNGFARHLYFRSGAFVAGNATMSGVGTDTDWRKEGGVHFIRVDDQRFEVPDVLVSGTAAQ